MIMESRLVKEGLLNARALEPLLAERALLAKGRSLYQVLLLCRWYEVHFEV